MDPQALPSAGGIKGELVVDVGSRLGCAIYAAVVLGDAGEAVGVELNRELCDLQTAAFEALGAVDRVKVVCGDIAGRCCSKNLPDLKSDAPEAFCSGVGDDIVWVDFTC